VLPDKSLKNNEVKNQAIPTVAGGSFGSLAFLGAVFTRGKLLCLDVCVARNWRKQSPMALIQNPGVCVEGCIRSPLRQLSDISRVFEDR